MKNPNHYGSITKLKGNRRKPWMVREGTSGKQKVIGYAETREDALILLAQFNQNAFDPDAQRMTVEQIFDLWKKAKTARLGEANRKRLIYAFKHIRSLAAVRYSSLKTFQMQATLDAPGMSAATQASVRSLWKHLDDFAMEIDAIQKRRSETLVTDSIPETSKEAFSDADLAALWKQDGSLYGDIGLLLVYTGFRINEALTLTESSYDAEERAFTGGSKTAAGKGRIVPVHHKIQHIVDRRLASSESGFLFESKGEPIRYGTALYNWERFCESAGIQKSFHECRHTFRSLLDSAGARSTTIDLLMGHKSPGTGERIYTHKTVEELRETVEMLP